jgi:hypothetical protein
MAVFIQGRLTQDTTQIPEQGVELLGLLLTWSAGQPLKKNKYEKQAIRAVSRQTILATFGKSKWAGLTYIGCLGIRVAGGSHVCGVWF